MHLNINSQGNLISLKRQNLLREYKYFRSAPGEAFCVDVFNASKCDRCDYMGREANTLKVHCGNLQLVAMLGHMLTSNGLKMANVVDELGCTESGEVVCPSCYPEASRPPVRGTILITECPR